MMIEADVNLGVLEGTLDIIPIMAHPPAVISDLSLEQFLETVIQALDQGGPGLKKGIKLDFKSNQVIEPALQILESKLDRVQFPVWVNGDVVKGPHRDGSGSDPRIIAPEVLFSLADQYIPTATVSPGPLPCFQTHHNPFLIRFCLGFTTSHPALNPEYTMEQVENMIQALDQNGYFNTGKRLTFPVRAVYAGKQISNPNRKYSTVFFSAVSFDVLKSLLDRTSENNHGVDSTLTLWGTDKLDEQEVLNLFTFIEDIGKNRVYFDVKFD